jgi:ABC-type multidrug transport system fused ATPase/permease subunit
VIRLSEAAVSLKRVNDFLFSDPIEKLELDKALNNNNFDFNEDNAKERKFPTRNSKIARRRFSRRLSLSIENNILNGTEIFIQNTTARYPDEEGMKSPAIRSINLNVKSGKLYGVVGAIGSGKSSLMNLLLEELQIVSGNFYVNKELSYGMF